MSCPHERSELLYVDLRNRVGLFQCPVCQEVTVYSDSSPQPAVPRTMPSGRFELRGPEDPTVAIATDGTRSVRVIVQ